MQCYEAQKGQELRHPGSTSRLPPAVGLWEGPFPFLCLFLHLKSKVLTPVIQDPFFGCNGPKRTLPDPASWDFTG